MRQDFDFDNKLNEVQQDIPGLSLVPRETNDDTIDYLKQFKEYWNFEKKFKYNSTFDTTFKKVTKEIGLNDKQMVDVMKDLIGTVIGDAAREIGLEWHMINNGDYLFGFYPKDTPSDCFAVPVLLVPYDFKFSAVKDKLLDWYADQKRGNKKKPKLQIVESNLGLNKRVQKKYQDIDAIENISEYVDLRLPSGTFWCNHNYGATSEEEPGEYFNFDDAQELDIKLPTKEDFIELAKYCEYKPIKVNGSKGMKFTSKLNGKSIFLPAAGYYFDTSMKSLWSWGYYWSSSLADVKYGFSFVFDSSSVYPAVYPEELGNQFYCYPVRAVQKPFKESSLGLNKHIQKKFNSKDGVSNVGTIDEETFNTIVKRYISDNDLHEVGLEDSGLMTFIQYSSLRDNDGHMLWFFPLFIYNNGNTDDSASFALCFWTDGERIKMEIYEMTWDPSYRSMAISLESEDVVKMLWTDDATVDNLNRIFNLLDLMREDIGHAANLAYDNQRILDACRKETITVIYKIKGEEARKLLDFLCSTSQNLIAEEAVESEGMLVESVDFDKHL